jgi:large conductance mechanosensitive channel
VRRSAAQGVRLDRGDFQRLGLLSHGFPHVGWHERGILVIIEVGGEGLSGSEQLLLTGSKPAILKGRSMIKGFKEFIARGNVIDLAVAVVIGAAFTAIVGALVQGFINPLIGVIFQLGDLSHWVWKVPTLSGGVATFAIGAILVAVINFLAVAVIVYFVFVYPMNVWRKRQAAKEAAGEPAAPPALTEQEILIQIRDLLELQGQSAGPAGTVPPAGPAQ